MKTTDWVEFEEHGQRYRVRAKYGMQKLGDQEPYFSITGETQRYGGYWREDSFGMLHDTIEAHMPELRGLLKWHLTFQEKGPSHYIANGLYWWDHYVGTRVVVDKHLLIGKSSSELGLKCFKSTVVFSFDEPEELPPVGASLAEVRDWLEHRLPRLMEAFRRDLASSGVVAL